MRFLGLGFLSACATLPAAILTLDASYEPGLKRNLEAVASDIRDIVRSRFRDSRPPLDLPISCRVDLAGPITQLDDWTHPTRIVIGLTSNGPYYSQFAFQLAHELGHVMLDPRRTNGDIETLCTALSLEALDGLTVKWTRKAPFPYASAHLAELRKYRRAFETDVLSRVPADVRDAVIAHRWPIVQRYLASCAKEREQLSQAQIRSQRGRDLQALAAMLLLSHSVDWPRLANLGRCTNPPPSADPFFRLLPLDPSCAGKSSALLCRIAHCAVP